MDRPAFYNVADFGFLDAFIKNVDGINAELKNAMKQNEFIGNTFKLNSDEIDHYTHYWVKDNGFHYDQIGYYNTGGPYSALTIYKKDYPIKTYDVANVLPLVSQLLKNVPHLYYSGCLKMDPHCYVDAHVHSRRHLIFHLLLNDLENGSCTMICGDEQRMIQKKGDAVVFDYSLLHHSTNNSDTERFNLVIDFNPF